MLRHLADLDLGRGQGRSAKFRGRAAALGLKRGDRVAIVGSNRPRLYWTFLAAQSLGRVPVPVYADSVADELAYVLDHAEVGMAVVEDQEQVDKILSVAERLPRLQHIVYDEARGLQKYEHTQLARVRGDAGVRRARPCA